MIEHSNDKVNLGLISPWAFYLGTILTANYHYLRVNQLTNPGLTSKIISVSVMRMRDNHDCHLDTCSISFADHVLIDLDVISKMVAIT